MTYKIIGDSCLDLTDELKKDSRFQMIPLTLQVGTATVVDDETFNQKKFIDMVKACPECPKTACPSPETFKEAYEAADAEGVFVITLSGHLSGSYNSAALAKKLYEEEQTEKGEQAQVDIFGEAMRGFWKSGPEESRHINYWLTDNCFGDYYTRGGLDYKQREMITFCFLSAQGGCEPQLTSHAAANMRIGNGKSFLIKIISQCLPFIGYPRSLNALRCVNEAADRKEEAKK